MRRHNLHSTYIEEIPLDLVTFARKPAAAGPMSTADLRPITVSSTVGKLIKKMILDPIFPVKTGPARPHLRRTVRNQEIPWLRHAPRHPDDGP